MSFQNRKRVTVRLKCPNPLFEEWLIGWKEQAVSKDSKMQYIFNHALTSLRKYPMPLESGRDCKILKGFGDKICKMLDEKLKEHKKMHGDIIKVNSTLHSVDTDIQNTKTANSNLSRKSESKLNNYVPQYGSGGYAILITLYKQSLQPNYPGFLLKADIIKHGKYLVKSSFTKPDQGSRYTAFSSMKTLIAKNLVSKCSRPSKFSLTDQGEQLARKLHDNSDVIENDAIENDKASNNDCNKIERSSENLASNEDLRTNYITDKYVSSNFTKEYENTKETNITKFYDVNIPDDFTDELLRNVWNSEDDTFSSDRNSDDYKYQNDMGKMDFEAVTTCRSNLKVDARTSAIEGEPVGSSEGAVTSKEAINKIPYDELLFSRSSSLTEAVFKTKQKADNTNTFQKFYSTNSTHTAIKPSVTDETIKNKENSLKRFASSRSVTSTTSTVSVVETFLMAPSSFDIILYVDNHETSGSSNSHDDEILVSLTRQGIKHEVKDLKVGDFLWICKDRISKKELVLPYIIERKRMDDFAHSIKDKRYYEQKFRLKRSGIENLIYLVESHGKNQHLGLPLQNIYQAASNTAVQENFFIKFTENTKETVDYLVNFSRILVKMFKSKTLASCSKDDIQPVDISDDLVSLITFKELNESSVKNKKMKVTDLFVKMLIQISGVSVERALAITQLYPTPILLKRMFQENPGGQGEKLLSCVKYGRQGKSIGNVLSKTIYQAFSRTHY